MLKIYFLRVASLTIALSLGACGQDDPAPLAPEPADMAAPDSPPDESAPDLSADLAADLVEDAAQDDGIAQEDLAQDAGADAEPDVEGDAQTDGDVDMAPPLMPGDPPAGDPSLTIGTGQDTFIPLLQTDTVRWEAGPQGGYHIWTGLIAADTLLDDLDDDQRRIVELRFSIHRQDGTLLAATTRLGGLRPAPSGGWLSLGQYAVLEAPIRPRRLTGERLRYRATLTSPTGRAAWREVYITSDCCD